MAITPGPAAAPALDRAARDYLLDLARAAVLARLYRDQAALADRQTEIDSAQHRQITAGPRPSATHCPIGLVISHHQTGVWGMLDHSQAQYALAVDWHTHAATLALRAAIKGRQVTDHALEQHSVGRQVTAAAGVDTDLRPIPGNPAELATGQTHLDLPVAQAWEQLRDLYRKIDDLVRRLDEDSGRPGLTDWDPTPISELDDAMTRLPDVMAVYANALTQAVLSYRA